ncbi:MAG TPA: type I methionyl aminopeptidase [Candidatus Paceibacterota bacterium]|jgi:methionyl aminopeptidase|nr:type I methionyl aminopeptidase [Candidatus Paceibacterota bacterium]
MIIIKTDSEIERLRKGGPILAAVLQQVAEAVKPGITTKSLDDLAYKLITEAGCTPAFLNYKPEGARKPYPASLITSINSEVVHGIPGDTVLKEGDIISLDLGLNYEGVFLDHAITVPVGEISTADKKLLSVTKSALEEGIAAIVPGATVGDIGHAIEEYVKPHKYGIIRGLSGHGVGRAIHEDPYVPNYGKPGKGTKLQPGMVIAIEPMITRGSEDVIELDDGYTLKTPDNSHAAHFEHTVLIKEDGYPEILTLV